MLRSDKIIQNSSPVLVNDVVMCLKTIDVDILGCGITTNQGPVVQS